MTASVPALFLDRDGVINVDHPYVHTRERFEFIDGIFDLSRAAAANGYRIVVVTNQAGIGRGLYAESDFHALTAWMCAVFEARGAPVDKVYFCPFHPVHGLGRYLAESPRRKPAPGMILDAAGELDIDLGRSILVGNNESDILAGKAAGIATNVLFAPDGATPTCAERVIGDLRDAIALLARGAPAARIVTGDY